MGVFDDLEKLLRPQLLSSTISLASVMQHSPFAGPSRGITARVSLQPAGVPGLRPIPPAVYRGPHADLQQLCIATEGTSAHPCQTGTCPSMNLHHSIALVAADLSLPLLVDVLLAAQSFLQ